MKKQINEFVDYLINVKKSSQNTAVSYKRDLERMALFMEKRGITDVTGITEDALSSYSASLYDEHFATSSIIRHYTSIKAFFRYMVENGNISDNPALILSAPKVEKTVPRVLSTVEVEYLLSQDYADSPKGKRDRAIMELLYATGLKASELVDLKMSNIDLSLGCLRLKRNSASKRDRLIPYGKKAKDALNDYLLTSRSVLLSGNNDDETVFLNCNGRHMSRQGLWKLIKTYVKKAGVKSDITPFTLRHSFAVHLVDNGADVASVQEMMGYADSNTISRYITKQKKTEDPFEWARIRN
ncbi:tyrosine-type recombinase/integrase [Butyrivibrio proteoclasticus]|uniref:tyrosine-type recombinase/integrase n=1 Tax=Butyrivibrio proteoclasticus TaxID=43305 RepID=UPI0006847EAF|nr:tyrosine-type recombinase/integrase [Butyrivibrio proteoclasticus]